MIGCPSPHCAGVIFSTASAGSLRSSAQRTRQGFGTPLLMLRVLRSCAPAAVGRFSQRLFSIQVKNKTAPKNSGPTRKNMTIPSDMKLNTGQLVITPAALETLMADDILTALGRHIRADWGDVTSADRDENNFSLREGFRILSVYHSGSGEQFWIITEADRSLTTVLCPSDY
jgi:hypothetical protein